MFRKGIAYILPKAFSFEMDKNMHVKHPNQSSAFPCYPDNVTKPSPMFPLYPNLCSCVSIFQQNQFFNNVIDRFQYRFTLENGWGKPTIIQCSGDEFTLGVSVKDFQFAPALLQRRMARRQARASVTAELFCDWGLLPGCKPCYFF